MKMKKVLSILTAVAMSATAFAGLSASAAEYEVDEVVFGTLADGVVTAQTDFEGDTAVEKADTRAGHVFFEGTAMDVKGGVTAKFAEPVTEGKVRFATSYTVNAGQTQYLKLVDSSNNTVVGLYVNSTRDTGTINNFKVGADETGSAAIYTPRSVPYYVDITLDLDAKKYTYSITHCSGGSSGTVNKVTTTTGNGELSGITDVAGFNARSSNYSYYVDNIMLYSEKTTEALYDYSITYSLDGEVKKTTSGSVAADTVVPVETMFEGDDGVMYCAVADSATSLTVTADGENTLDVPVRLAEYYTADVVTSTGFVLKSFADLLEGGEVTYSNSKYLTDADKKVTAVADGNVFTTTVAPTSNDDIVVPYTAYEGVAYFAEYEDISDNAECTYSQFSGGKGRRAENDGATAFAVAEAGMYKITVVASCRNVSSSSPFNIYKNEVVEANLLVSGDVKGTSQNTVQEEQSFYWDEESQSYKSKGGTVVTENIELAAGDVIIVQGDSGQTWIDYILVEKTADIAEPEIITDIAVINQYVNGTVLEDGTEVEGDATSLKATFTISGETAFNYVSFTVSDVTAEKNVTVVSGDGATVTYGIIVDAVIEADAVTSAVSFVE